MTTKQQPSHGRPTQEPTTRANSSPIDGTIQEHPAYAQIQASRISTHAVLYGSDFTHQNTVRISICPSTLHRSLSNDWAMGSHRADYIEVELSEAQWATFVSSMKIGSGTQCTLRYKDGQTIPGLPNPASRTEQFEGEALERMEKAMASLKELEADIAGSGLSKAKQTALLSKLRGAQHNIGPNIKFVAESFAEHMEVTVEKAKIEVNAYATNVINRAGLAAIAGAGPGLSLDYRTKGVIHDESNA